MASAIRTNRFQQITPRKTSSQSRGIFGLPSARSKAVSFFMQGENYEPQINLADDGCRGISPKKYLVSTGPRSYTLNGYCLSLGSAVSLRTDWWSRNWAVALRTGMSSGSPRFVSQ